MPAAAEKPQARYEVRITIAELPAGPTVSREADLRQSMWKAILTDNQFWLPVLVLAIGIGVLAAVR